MIYSIKTRTLHALNDLNREFYFVKNDVKFKVFAFANDESVINNSFDIINLSSLKMNFDFSFIFTPTIFDSLQN